MGTLHRKRRGDVTGFALADLGWIVAIAFLVLAIVFITKWGQDHWKASHYDEIQAERDAAVEAKIEAEKLAKKAIEQQRAAEAAAAQAKTEADRKVAEAEARAQAKEAKAAQEQADAREALAQVHGLSASDAMETLADARRTKRQLKQALDEVQRLSGALADEREKRQQAEADAAEAERDAKKARDDFRDVKGELASCKSSQSGGSGKGNKIDTGLELYRFGGSGEVVVMDAEMDPTYNRWKIHYRCTKSPENDYAYSGGSPGGGSLGRLGGG